VKNLGNTMAGVNVMYTRFFLPSVV
jgi:hypothetical protein